MMERRAKERLIGASILVVLIVLIVPELLSGPKPAAPVAEPQRLPAAASTPEPTRTVTVDLATSKAPAQNETEAADAAFARLQAAAVTEGAAVAAWSLVHGLSHLLLDGMLPRESAPALMDAILTPPAG